MDIGFAEPECGKSGKRKVTVWVYSLPSTMSQRLLDPRGHLWVTWGVYLWAGKPPLADIILSHPPDLT